MKQRYLLALAALLIPSTSPAANFVRGTPTAPHRGAWEISLPLDDPRGNPFFGPTPSNTSLSRLVKVTETGQVIYKAEKDACRAFPDPQDDELARGLKRNFQMLDPLDFLAEFRQHIPPKGAQLIRYYGWYSNKARGMRREAAEAAAATTESPAELPTGDAAPAPASRRASPTWAMLIKRLYEIDPSACPECGGQMKVVAFIEPPQVAVIETILRHCGLWCPSSPRGPPSGNGLVHDAASSGESRELTFVDEATFWATC